MGVHRWIKVLVSVLGFSSVALCIVLFLPNGKEDDDSIVRRSAAARFSRHTRAAAGGDCFSVLITRETVSTLTSPNYPDYYPRNADCQWLLTTLRPNQTISLRIESLALEQEEECRLDSLQVFLGSSVLAPSLGPYCGHLNDLTLDTNASTVLLVFHSDKEYEDQGFSIDYYIPTPNKGCQEFLTESVGTLTSPGFPDNYPDDANCFTLITAQADHKISLNFESVDLEDGVNCTFDYVEVFDGSTTDASLLGRICQQTNVRHFQSSSNNLLVHFFSDNNVNGKGYKAKYFSLDKRSSPIGDCTWESGKNNGSISSPNYPDNYPSFANCSLWILAPLGSRILVTIDSMLLEIDANCSYDFLRISEGTPPDSKILGQFCGRGSEPKTLESSQHELRVEFYSDSFVEFSGFKLRYEFLEREAKEEASNEDSDSGEMFLFTLKPADATLPAGSSHMLHCATDHPNARIRWLKGELFLGRDSLMSGMRLLENDTLWIQQMRPHFAGEYTCIAVAPEGEISAKAKIAFEAHGADGPCRIELRKTPSDAEYEEGEFAYMECRSDATGLSLSWEKDGTPMTTQGHVTVLKNGYIFMEEVRLEDAGLYTCVAEDALTGCKRKVSATLKVNKKKKLEEICGISKFGQSAEGESTGKIIGGKNAQKGAYPWQVMLWEPHRGSFCGGTLLNERWIATAGHCVNKEQTIPWHSIVIKLGKHATVEKDDEEEDNYIADKSAVVVHPNFNGLNFDNDLALIRMRHRVYFSDYIRPVCLGDRNVTEALLSGDGDATRIRMGTVIGWGDLKHKGAAPKYLQEIKLPIVDQQVCRNSTRKEVTRNMFCAGYAQEVIGDSCHGDSGGPFLMERGGRWYMVGIVSWGEECGVKNKYGFYTRVPNHLAWIHSIIQS